MSSMNLIKRLAVEEEAATAVEYGLITALIAIALVGVLGTLGADLGRLFTTVSGNVTGATGP